MNNKIFLFKRRADLEAAPKLFGAFLAIFIVLLCVHPIGWQFFWVFLIGGVIAGAAVVAAIYFGSALTYRIVSIFSAISLVTFVLVLWRAAPVSPLGVLLWAFAFAVPRDLLLVVFRRPLRNAIDRSLPRFPSDKSSNV